MRERRDLIVCVCLFVEARWSNDSDGLTHWLQIKGSRNVTWFSLARNFRALWETPEIYGDGFRARDVFGCFDKRAPGHRGYCAITVFMQFLSNPTQVYEWVRANSMLGGSSTMDYHTTQGRELNTPSHFMMQKRDKLGPTERLTSLTSPCVS